MENYDKEMAYILAKHKAEKLKRFYVHGVIFLVANAILMTLKVSRNINNGETFSQIFFDFSTWSTLLIWGIVIAIHAFSIYGNRFVLGAKWEEDKIKQYIEEEQQHDKI